MYECQFRLKLDGYPYLYCSRFHFFVGAEPTVCVGCLTVPGVQRTLASNSKAFETCSENLIRGKCPIFGIDTNEYHCGQCQKDPSIRALYISKKQLKVEQKVKQVTHRELNVIEEDLRGMLQELSSYFTTDGGHSYYLGLLRRKISKMTLEKRRSLENLTRGRIHGE